MSVNLRGGLAQTVHEKLVNPADRGHIYPSSGVGFLSTGTYKQVYGATNASYEDLWQTFLNVALSTVSSMVDQLLGTNWFPVKGLKSDAVILDVVARTPEGNVLIPNLPLATNALDDINHNWKENLKNGIPLHVKIIYDGGKASECTPLGARFDAPSPAAINAEQKGLGAPGAGGIISGSSTTNNASITNLFDASGLNGPPSNTGFLSGSQLGLPMKHGLLGDWTGEINRAAASFNMDPCILGAIQLNEAAGGNPSTPGGGGSLGLFQMQPAAWEDVISGAAIMAPGFPNEFPQYYQNIVINRANGIAQCWFAGYYLEKLIKYYSGDIRKAVAAWNVGYGNITQGGDPAEDQIVAVCARERQRSPDFGDPSYVSKWEQHYRALKAQSINVTKRKVMRTNEAKRQDLSGATAMSAFQEFGGA
jgi:hypothetical protein